MGTRTLARWTHDGLSLIVQVSDVGVHSISLEDHDPHQLLLWPDADAPVPDLAAVAPFGKELAGELAAAIQGRPFTPTVPWRTEPAWHAEIYRKLLRLPRGQVTDVFTVMCGYPRSERTILATIRECPLVPLVPLRRAACSQRQPIRFRWGQRWRDYLLEQERRHQTYRKGDTP